MGPVKRKTAFDLWDVPYGYRGPLEDDLMEPAIHEHPSAQPVDRPPSNDEGQVRKEKERDGRKLNPTYVTPLIFEIAGPYYRGLETKAGPHTRSIDILTRKRLVKHEDYIKYMSRLLEILHGPPAIVQFDVADRLASRSRHNHFELYKRVRISKVDCRINDDIIVPVGYDETHVQPEFPRSSTIDKPVFAGDLFWFARIVSIMRDDSRAHIQWYQHGCKTVMEDVAHPQELFLTNLCDDISLKSVLGRCEIRRVIPGERPRDLKCSEMFCSRRRLAYDQKLGIFRDISRMEQEPNKQSTDRGIACNLCKARRVSLDRIEGNCTRIADEEGNLIGFIKEDVEYHCLDVALVRSELGPCDIAQITSIEEVYEGADEPFKLTVKLFGRVNDLARRGDDISVGVYEERHLFLTDKEITSFSNLVLGKCFVLPEKGIRSLKHWLGSASFHFYISYTAPSLELASKHTLRALPAREFLLCSKCMHVEIVKTQTFLNSKAHAAPLRIFDPFAGVGTFPLAMCQHGNMKLTHAIEVDPSAAMTLRKNSPDTLVYNECSNKVLQYALESSRGLMEGLQCSGRLPKPPQQSDIDSIITGFPCQPHSTLNMYQRGDDLENELYLNVLSWVDYLKPKYCAFENVEGFVSYSITSTQNSVATIERGGIKIIIRALTAMGYQVHFTLLQAGHYGTPQSRVRFFMWAARTGCKLPKFPARTHDFPRTRTLDIKFPNGDIIPSVETASGIAPLPFITIQDAISDLKRWDWVNPHNVYPKTEKDHQEKCDRRHILQISVNEGEKHCGIDGLNAYEHRPRSAFQATCRHQNARDLQHITPCFKGQVVESVCNIPLIAGASDKNLKNKPNLQPWMSVHPLSANARSGYRSSYYVRLSEDGYFDTTITNIYVTAKQAKILNPWCKRILSVRELARSQGFPDHFQFYALDSRIRTIHRQIGNAVPWQLGQALGRELEKVLYSTDQVAEQDSMNVDMPAI